MIYYQSDKVIKNEDEIVEVDNLHVCLTYAATVQIAIIFCDS